MPASPFSDQNKETKSEVAYNPASVGLEGLWGLLMRLQTPMKPMIPAEDDIPRRQQLYNQFALVAMLIRTQTAETRIQFIDLAYLFNPKYHPSIDTDHIVKIFAKWIPLKSKAEELQKNAVYIGVVYDLCYFMALYEHKQKNIFQYIPEYDPIDIDLPMSLAAGIYGQETPVKRLWIRDVCLELAMTMKDTHTIRVQFLNLAYFFEPLFRTGLMNRFSEDTVKFYIREQWQMMQNVIAFRNRKADNYNKTKTLLEILERAMNSYTVTPAQSQRYAAPSAHVIPVRFSQNRMYTRSTYAQTPLGTRNELASQETTSDRAGPVVMRPCRCEGCPGCDGTPGRCRCRCADADT
jgi:hypothetical protein